MKKLRNEFFYVERLVPLGPTRPQSKFSLRSTKNTQNAGDLLSCARKNPQYSVLFSHRCSIEEGKNENVEACDKPFQTAVDQEFHPYYVRRKNKEFRDRFRDEKNASVG